MLRLSLLIYTIFLSETQFLTPVLASGLRDETERQTCGINNPDPISTMIRKRFVLFGDSLTQQSFEEGGWGSKLVSRYQRKADVTLRGYSGYNTRWEHKFVCLCTEWYG